MVVSLVALFVAVSGSGVAFATVLIPNNSIGTAQLKNAAVTSAKVHAHSLTASNIKSGSLLAGDFATGQLREGPHAYATVDNESLSFLGTHPGFTAVSRPGTGVYCLKLASGVPTVNAHTVASPEWDHSSGSDLLVEPLTAVSVCAAGTLEIHTYQLPSGTATASNSVGFTVLIP